MRWIRSVVRIRLSFAASRQWGHSTAQGSGRETLKCTEQELRLSHSSLRLKQYVIWIIMKQAYYIHYALVTKVLCVHNLVPPRPGHLIQYQVLIIFYLLVESTQTNQDGSTKDVYWYWTASNSWEAIKTRNTACTQVAWTRAWMIKIFMACMFMIIIIAQIPEEIDVDDQT